MYQALYRKYRPKSFEGVVGQDVIVKTLKNSIKNNLVSHAYLLAGPRGTGKTTIAKVFAKILNCHNPNDLEPCNECISCEQANNNQNIDIIEIDAASNNGVDEIREIRNKITLVPTNSKYKIYIIDEVHMLTQQAFNALLKTLEEPPSHIIFIFATTEPQKIPQTILSRCQRFDYKKINNSKIVERLKFIASQENICISDEAISEIAKLSDGGMRDSISLLDQALAYCDNEIKIEDIHEINGSLTETELEAFILDILNDELISVVNKIEQYDENGKNLIKIVRELIDKMKDCLLYFNAPKLVEKNEKFYKKVKDTNNYNAMYKYIKAFSSLINEMKNSNNSKVLLEIELIKNMKMTDEYKEKSYIPSSMKNQENQSTNNISEEFMKGREPNNQQHFEKTDDNEVNKEKKVYNTLSINKETFREFKEIRINNSLSKFSQKERERVKNELKMLEKFVTDEEKGKYASIIVDGELKSASNNYLMFMYKSDLLAESFNLEIKEIENLLYMIFNIKYNVIAIDSDDWDYLKIDYNKNKDKYTFKSERVSIDSLYKLEEIKEESKNNSIDEMFDDIIEYE